MADALATTSASPGYAEAPAWRATADARLTSLSGYDAVRIGLSAVLLAAAALKGHQLATEPVAETSLFTSRWFLIAVVEWELAFGLWLLGGTWPRRTWNAAVLWFGSLAGVSLAKALSGEASCGCFGSVRVSPWYAFVFDSGALAALLCWRPPTGTAPRHGRARLAVVGVVSLLAGIPAALAMGTNTAALLTDDGQILGESDFVVLEPETWVGKRFPLVRYIEIADDLSRGEWIVLFYRHDCSNCEAALAHVANLSGSFRSGARRLALIEMPPYGVDTGLTECRYGRLRDVRKWFLETPAELTISNSTVVRVVSRQSGTRHESAHEP